MKNNFITKIIGATLAFAMMIGGAVGINAVKEAKRVGADSEPITNYASITAGDYYIGATTSNTDYYLYVNGANTSNSIAGTAVTSTENATIFTFAAGSSANKWTIKFKDNNHYLGLSSSKDNGKVQVLNSSQEFTASNKNSLIKLCPSGKSCLSKNSSGTQFGNYQDTQPGVWLLPAGGSGGSGGDPATYTGVTVSEKTALTGTYKGEAYYECQASVTGTGDFSSAVTWSVTSSNEYGTGTSVANKASIDTNGKITFLDNCTVYAWATAADAATHNTTGFAVTASGLQDNPVSAWTKITDDVNVSLSKVYALSNDGALFASNSVSSNYIPLTNSLSSIGFVVLESTNGGYYVRFATETAGVWSANGNYIKWYGDGTKFSSTASPDSTNGKWNIVEDGTNGVYLKNTSSNRHFGLNGTTDIRAYAAGNLEGNAPVYLYEAGELPIINCAVIELTGKPTDAMSLGDTATLGYTAYDENLDAWEGDVTYSISNESTSGVVELSATSGASVTLTAKKVGTARVSVQDDAGNAEPDYVDITVLADPERVDLPVGSYTVTISAADETSSTVPATRDYEIKPKEGSGAGRVWYRNLTVAFNGITVLTNFDEYESAKTTGALTVTNNSNATISNVEVHYYKYLNDGVGIYVNDNMLTPTSSTGTSGTDDDLYRGYTNITGNSFALCNKNSSYTNKFYSVTITLTVVDENEEFLNLAIIKGATATSFTEGDAPNHNGLTVRENYSTDGETVSRYEDVTASVVWNYSIETIARRTKSYTVTATYGGHTSAAVTIDGFTVTELAKYSLFGSEIVDGDYIIQYNGKALKNTISSSRADYSEVTPVNNTILTNATDIVWHIAKEGESNYYTIYNDEAGEYLASTDGNNQAQLVDNVASNSLWKFELSEGKFNIINKAKEDASIANQYLRENGTYGFACYQSATGGPLSLYRLNAEGYLKSASAVATYTEEESGNILRLGSSIPVETWNYITATETIEDYGVMIYKTDSVANITSETPVEDAYRDTEVAPAVARKGNGNPPTAENGNYVFTARLKVSNPNTVFCAASFVVIDGQYYFFNEQHVTAGQLA